MTKLTRKLRVRVCLLGVYAMLFVVASSLTAEAYCILPDVAEGFDRAKSVFAGEVVAITPPRSNSAEAPFFERAHLVEFEIEKSWKGMPFGNVKVWVLMQGYEPALTSISKGERYLVYAEPVIENEVATNELMVGMCNRTALLPKNGAPPRGPLFRLESEKGARDLRALDSLWILKRR